MKSVTVEEMLAKVEAGARLIDVREVSEYRAGHLPKALNLPMSTIQAHVSEVHNGDCIICQSGARSFNTCAWLESLGLDVINVKGGTSAYRGQLEL